MGHMAQEVKDTMLQMCPESRVQPGCPHSLGRRLVQQSGAVPLAGYAELG